jgi:hypothetical protein
MMSDLPPAVKDAIEECRSKIAEYWLWGETDDDDAVDPACPLWRLVDSLRNSGPDEEARLRLARLAFFAARRALTCWEIYCDGDGPGRAVEAVGHSLAGDQVVGPWDDLCVPASPAYRGNPLWDCRFSGTSFAAQAAAHAAQYLVSGALADAYRCVGNADLAFDESPFAEEDHFREWLLDFAVPITYEGRDMTALEREALREYDAAEIPNMRDEQSAGGMADD